MNTFIFSLDAFIFFCAVCLRRETDIAQFCAAEVESAQLISHIFFSALLLEGNSRTKFSTKLAHTNHNICILFHLRNLILLLVFSRFRHIEGALLTVK